MPNDLQTELDIAKAIASGTLKSPQLFKNMALFAIRITGTGVAYRKKLKEFVYRPTEHYLNDEFLARCNGLPVIFEHPETNVLNSEEFSDRIVGTVMLPYIQDDEVWAIARIYDQAAIEIMVKDQMSTSPAVVFKSTDDNEIIELDGNKVLKEGKPELIDHIAICAKGVWDKAQTPTGVLTDLSETGNIIMTEEEKKAAAEAAEKEKKEKADAEGSDKLDKVLAAVDSLSSGMQSLTKRMDSWEEKSRKDSESDEEKKAREEKEKADAEAEAAEKEKTEKEAKEKADSETNEQIRKRIEAIENSLPKHVSDEDYAQMADAQARADSVASAYGDSAPRPLQGETLLAYRKRLASKFKQHSKDYKDVDINAINDAALLNVVEGRIYADAMEAAMHPAVASGSGLREIKKRDQAGRQISTFVGDISTWTEQFKAPRRYLTAINKGA
jgi:hypothetical protein